MAHPPMQDLKSRLRDRVKQNLGVDWFLPLKKRRFTSSTGSTSDILSLLAGQGFTFREALSRIHYDEEAKDIVKYFIQNGYGDDPMNWYVV